ncbi:uncharacterized protein LOC122404778 [Colletes gigas]|uniref:uncharacterized protein LOC122404778 n=1 Tax=Colletes gigas TaxID=935657 RepID=UPI001C9ACD62|nr:uncharacterized protein LOC122404778 [Colletes gigas]
MVITEFLDLAFNVDNPDDFSDNIYVTLEMIVICFKMCSLSLKRKNIAILIDTLQRTPFASTDSQEIEIRTRFDKAVEWNTKLYTFVLELCVVWTVLATLVASTTSKELLFRAWLPIDYSTTITFYFALGFQILCAVIGSLSNVACDSLFSGLLIHIYCQFEILGHRLKNIIENENDLVKQCNRHHDQIYKFAAMVNEEFKAIVFVQFLMSISVMCFNLYLLARKKFISEIVETVLYILCTLMQIYYYCWYGNEVKLKSLEVTDMIFGINWTSLNNNTVKILLMSMRRATIPIEFTSFYVVSVNLESFKALLKTSYSACNLLQQTHLIFVVDNVDDFSDNIYVTLVYMITCFKTCSILITRRNTMMLVDILEKEPFLPMDVEEIEIRTKFDKEAEKLPYRAWFPFDYSPVLKFSFVYLHQATSALLCCLSNVACDSLFSCLLVQIYCQFEILGYRLHNIRKNENDLVKQCARHHNHIYKLVSQVSYSVSVLSRLFSRSKKLEIEKSLEVFKFLTYMSCTLLQIYYYCWYGNEVKLKSLEVPNMIFESDWTTLKTKTQKILLMIMKRSLSPIEFTSLYIVSVNLEAFKVLLKTSYSIYNLLRRVDSQRLLNFRDNAHTISPRTEVTAA